MKIQYHVSSLMRVAKLGLGTVLCLSIKASGAAIKLHYANFFFILAYS